MNRSAIVAFALVASLLVTTMPAATAGDTNLEIASIHTTNSDFSAATTLQNVTIAGTGTSARVVYNGRTNRRIVDDAEDGDLTEWTWDTQSVFIKQSTAMNGSYLLNFSHQGSSYDMMRTSGEEAIPDPGDSFSLNFTIKQSGDYFYVTWARSGEFDLYYVEIDPETNEIKLGVESSTGNGSYVMEADSSFGWATNSKYTLRIRWEADGDITATLSNSTGTQKTLTGSDGQHVDGKAGIRTGGAGIEVWVDDWTVQDIANTGTYTSAGHSADKVEQAFIDLSLSNANATVTWQKYDGNNWVDQTTTTYTTDGNKTVTWPVQDVSKWRVQVKFHRTGSDPSAIIYDEGVQFNASQPTVDNSSASPQGGTKLSSDTIKLKIDVNDSDFATAQGDTVTVEYYHKGPNDNSYTKIGTDSRSSNGTASLQHTFGVGGDHKWYAVAKDSYGESIQSQTFTFTVPGKLTIYNESAPESNLSSVTVTAVFYGDEKIITNQTTDGTINLTGKPVNGTLVVELEASDYHTRTAVIRDIYTQQRVYMLNKSAVTSVETRFILDDKTGQYDKNSTTLIIQRPLNISGTTKWEPVAGDYFGVKGVTVDLEEGQRYRLIIQNDQGDRRILGHYSAPASETVTLTVESSSLTLDKTDTYAFNATKQGNTITAKYSDPENATTDLRIIIYEYGNKSNEIYNQSMTGGPFGNVTVTQPLNSQQNNTSWVVRYEATRNGSQHVGEQLVGNRRAIQIDMNTFWLEVGAMGLVLVIPSITPGNRAAMGAILASLLAGVFWWLQILPAGTGIGVVTAGTFIGLVFKLRERGGEVQ